jgi:hypothetical protein
MAIGRYQEVTFPNGNRQYSMSMMGGEWMMLISGRR